MSETVQLGRPSREPRVRVAEGCPSAGSVAADGVAVGGDSEAGLLACRPREEPSLVRAGWSPRFVADRRMVAEATATYVDLGFEVTTLPLEEEGVAEACAGCALAAGEFCVVYTRPG